MMELGLKMRCKSVSYQSIAEIFLGTEHKDVRRLRLYEPFMDALRQFAIVHNFYHHGIVSEAIQARHGCGKTECPACIGTSRTKSPIAVTMDGFESASKKSVAAGGGGNHGFYAMAKGNHRTLHVWAVKLSTKRAVKEFQRLMGKTLIVLFM
ncbi:hypothetical protein BCR33DRAFT_433336 [Rhizoclosmatium globosum]|uniref:Uncharacterized protein n=1 Tax=Rhizoclosmatium globosum TaxID=329046 RepID=A0A1Y2BTT6_9FUNG|nr:hypothetical protein BCR33DRAFT_433336 [Rhizoclosmatium globosum]|eukprot:ORY38153.1 hypothetical protein BCR33DRAFT_433336 [Rhizoclosmatium globosum]